MVRSVISRHCHCGWNKLIYSLHTRATGYKKEDFLYQLWPGYFGSSRRDGLFEFGKFIHFAILEIYVSSTIFSMILLRIKWDKDWFHCFSCFYIFNFIVLFFIAFAYEQQNHNGIKLKLENTSIFMIMRHFLLLKFWRQKLWEIQTLYLSYVFNHAIYWQSEATLPTENDLYYGMDK